FDAPEPALFRTRGPDGSDRAGMLRAVKRILLAALLTACGTPPAADEPRSLSPEAREGAELYARYCALCHGDEGQGYAADNATRLNGQSFLRTATDDFLFTAIARGRVDTAMGAYGRDHGGPLTDVQIEKLVAHVRGWQRGPAIDLSEVVVSGDAERGSPVWTEHCASCHE